MKKLGKMLSAFVCCLGVAICIIVILMFILDRDGHISDLVWTNKTLESYENLKDDFSVEYIKAYNDAYFTEDGYFSVSATRWIPSVSQWQMTIRYNKSTLENLKKDLKLKELPSGDLFTFALVDDTGRVYSDFLYKKEIKGRYTYYRLVFDDVVIKKVEDIKIYIYFIKDVKDGVYPETPLGELPLFYAEMPRDNYNYKKELPDNGKQSEGMMSSDELLK